MKPAAIIAQARSETLARVNGVKQVLLVQDTTSFNFSHHPATTGLGPLENKYMAGFLAHSTLAVSPDGVPLGVLDQQIWARDPDQLGLRDQRHERACVDKESYKWVAGLPTDGLVSPQTQAIVVCDAEAHSYEFLEVLAQRGLDYLVRAADARSFTPDSQGLFEAVSQQAVQHTFTLALKRRADREPRQAQLELRFGTVTLRRPKRAEAAALTLTVQVVDVIEPQPPNDEKAVHWLLLTSLTVESVEQAHQIVTSYTYRWLIERFHYVLKSGCKLEESHLREEPRLERLLAVYSLVAWRLLALTYQARVTPDVPCTVALQTEEWQALYLFIQRTQPLPDSPPSLRQAVRWIAQLGGFLGRNGDGEPGVKVLWRGWTRLQDIVATYTLFHPSEDVGNA